MCEKIPNSFLYYSRTALRGLSEAQEVMATFCKTLADIDTTVFIPGVDYTSVLPYSVQVHESGTVQIQTIYEFRYVDFEPEMDSSGDFFSSSRNFYGNYTSQRSNSDFRDKKVTYRIIASYTPNGVLKSIELKYDTNYRPFMLLIGEQKIMVSGHWFDREGFEEYAFQHSTSSEKHAFDIGFVSDILQVLKK